MLLETLIFITETPAIRPLERFPSNLELVSPSDFDHHYWGRQFYEELLDTRRRLERFKMENGTDNLEPSKQEKFDRLQASVSVNEKQNELYKTMVREIGPVFSKSGSAVRRGQVSDWALLNLPQDRRFKNKVFFLFSRFLFIPTDEFQVTNCRRASGALGTSSPV